MRGRLRWGILAVLAEEIPPAEGNQLLARAGTLKSAIGCA
jgi:hypothetical protein